MLAPAAVSWAVWVGILHVDQTPLAFMGYHYTHLILTVLALGELVADKLPFTPSRKTPPAFIFRIISGGLCGATIGASVHSIPGCIIIGVLGAVAGTLGGASARARLAALFHHDLPAAFIEDAIAIVLAAACVQGLR
jgi:uncharacterized membrane protein